MAQFVYNDTKNASSSHTTFELYYGYYFQLSYEKNIDSYSKFKLTNKLLAKL